MSLFHLLGGPIAVFFGLVVLLILGFTSTQTGWIAIALLCAWPLLWGVTAWSIRGLRDSYEIRPKQNARKNREVRGREALGETFT